MIRFFWIPFAKVLNDTITVLNQNNEGWGVTLIASYQTNPIVVFSWQELTYQLLSGDLQTITKDDDHNITRVQNKLPLRIGQVLQGEAMELFLQ